MICPRCGHEMTIDSHRKISLNMCYECGYIEGSPDDSVKGQNNFEHMKTLNLNELAAFISNGLGINQKKVIEWLESHTIK